MEDSIHHKQLRQKLLNTIHQKGIVNVDVLEAMNRVPRHLFINERYSPTECYEDKALEIGLGQSISQPYTVAYQSSLLNVQPHEKILEIGTGSGYHAAILFEMNTDVYTVERQRELFNTTSKKLQQLGYSQIKTFFGDGNLGLKEHAPFDKIIVTAAAPSIPDALIEQLKPGGIMVLPVDGTLQKMIRITKTTTGDLEKEEFDYFQFVPLLNGVVDRKRL